MAARLRADADNPGRKPWTQPTNTERLCFGKNKRSLAYSNAKGFHTPVACYRRKRSQLNLRNGNFDHLYLTFATAYKMFASFEMNKL